MPRFRLSNPDLEVAFDDAWIVEAGAQAYRPTTQAFAAKPEPHQAERPFLVVPIDHVEPPRRDDGYRWFHYDRMVKILSGIARGDVLPPIEVREQLGEGEKQYAVHNGLHRFYASRALGFTHLPVCIIVVS